MPNTSETAYVDAVQGSQEERVSRTDSTVNERLTPADTAMHDKQWQSFWLCQKAGHCDA